MPLGWKRDEFRTKICFREKIFTDKRSAVDMKGRDHLKGEDMSRFRNMIASRANACCEIYYGIIGYGDGELHHDPAGYERRDMPDSVKWVHSKCHRRQHVQTHLKSIAL